MKQVDDWRDINFSRDSTKPARVRSLGANSAVTGFGNECEIATTDTRLHHGYVIFILTLLYVMSSLITLSCLIAILAY